jgi:hypothetical protein
MYEDTERTEMAVKRADDPVLEAEVERAIEPYRALLPPEMLEVLRGLVEMAYLEHPYGQRILHHLRPPPRMSESGSVLTEKGRELEAGQPASGARRRGA